MLALAAWAYPGAKFAALLLRGKGYFSQLPSLHDSSKLPSAGQWPRPLPLPLGLPLRPRRERREQTGIVYCLSRDDSEAVAAQIRELTGVPAAHYHAGMTPGQRMAVQNDWRAGRVKVRAGRLAQKSSRAIDLLELCLWVDTVVPVPTAACPAAWPAGWLQVTVATIAFGMGARQGLRLRRARAAAPVEPAGHCGWAPLEAPLEHPALLGPIPASCAASARRD